MESCDQAVGMAVEIASAVEGERVTECEGAKIFGQLLRFGHCGLIDQNGDDRNPAFQGESDF